MEFEETIYFELLIDGKCSTTKFSQIFATTDVTKCNW